MKICPYCHAENPDEAAACSFCGSHLEIRSSAPGASGAANRAEPTQPVRPRAPRRVSSAPGSYNTQPMPSNPSPTLYPRSTTAYPPGGTQPQVYVPPPPAPSRPASNPSASHFLPVLVIGLAAVLLFACGLAVWTLTSATGSAAARLRADLATQAAGIFPPAATSRPTETAQPAQPTPWPTFTALPQPATPPSASDPTPDATQSAITDKLLSEGCSNALDALSRLGDQVTNQPTIAFDSQWRASLNQAIADMKTHCGSLDTASPVPGQIGQVQQNLGKAQAQFDQASKLFDEGVQELAPAKLLEAGKHVVEAVKYLNQAISDLRKIGN